MITEVSEIFQRFDIILLMIIAGASSYSVLKDGEDDEVGTYKLFLMSIMMFLYQGGTLLLAVSIVFLIFT